MKLKYGYLIAAIAVLALVAASFTLLEGYGEAIASARLQGLSPERATGLTLGFISLFPIVLTVALAFITREVVFSLLAGLFCAYVILEGVFGSGGFFSSLVSILIAVSENLLKTATDSFRAAIIILCLCIGGMVEVINASGGFAALGRRITGNIATPKRAALTAQLLGMCLFFDDYANSLITGPVMRRITDDNGVSREKLAYIVDSTAAPIAGIAVISSWIAAELSAIESGFEVTGMEGSAYAHFLASIPFCFYNFAAVTIVFSTTLFGMEYGPMLHAERRARKGEPLKPGSACVETETGAVLEAGSVWSVLLPVLTLIAYAFVGFYVSGVRAAAQAGLETLSISDAFANADTVSVLMRAAILSSIVAIFTGCVTGRITISSGFVAWLRGMSGIMLTAAILLLAWGLSAAVGELGSAYYLVELVTLNLSYRLLPMIIFVVCCVISFGTGSFGCLMIVMPIAVPIAFSAVKVFAVPYSERLISACIAAVLSGSIFGDHCSPVTDTTILSAMGAGCDGLDHVKTQLPYALTAAAAVSLLGYLPAGFGLPPAISLALSAAAGVLAVRLLGRRVE